MRKKSIIFMTECVLLVLTGLQRIKIFCFIHISNITYQAHEVFILWQYMVLDEKIFKALMLFRQITMWSKTWFQEKEMIKANK